MTVAARIVAAWLPVVTKDGSCRRSPNRSPPAPLASSPDGLADRLRDVEGTVGRTVALIVVGAVLPRGVTVRRRSAAPSTKALARRQMVGEIVAVTVRTTVVAGSPGASARRSPAGTSPDGGGDRRGHGRARGLIAAAGTVAARSCARSWTTRRQNGRADRLPRDRGQVWTLPRPHARAGYAPTTGSRPVGSCPPRRQVGWRRCVAKWGKMPQQAVFVRVLYKESRLSRHHLMTHIATHLPLSSPAEPIACKRAAVLVTALRHAQQARRSRSAASGRRHPTS